MKKQIINWYNLPARIHSLFLSKQDKLTAGSNIQIEDNVISVTGGGGGSDLMVSITHADLLALVNTGTLVKGQQYRITDYVATVVADYDQIMGFPARSANHAFDIIVVADSESVLNENARAIRHNGDTYFPEHVNFASWELKYTIFNDNTKYHWADSVNGKGVVYFMRDDSNNALHYDFKSIQFQREVDGVMVWKYTFNNNANEDESILDYYNCKGNEVKTTSIANIVFGTRCSLNNINENCYNLTFDRDCVANIINANVLNMDFQATFNTSFSYNIIEGSIINKTLRGQSRRFVLGKSDYVVDKVYQIYLDNAGVQQIEEIV